mmetsp:Transcript_4045/g.3942  ORF Transcript_4045/g.3942 Transcript_4045/m.3942 type:complete len:139 (-) Transcript_4045:300-716(-)
MNGKNLRFALAIGSFSTGYLSFLYYSKHHTNQDLLKIASAGSLTAFTVESLFYFMDAINLRTKVQVENARLVDMGKEIWSKDGIGGFYRGYSVSFYASFLYGISYFTLYKHCKNMITEHKILNLQDTPMIFPVATILA